MLNGPRKLGGNQITKSSMSARDAAAAAAERRARDSVWCPTAAIAAGEVVDLVSEDENHVGELNSGGGGLEEEYVVIVACNSCKECCHVGWGEGEERTRRRSRDSGVEGGTMTGGTRRCACVCGAKGRSGPDKSGTSEKGTSEENCQFQNLTERSTLAREGRGDRAVIDLT
jgi:hypothetical protein